MEENKAVNSADQIDQLNALRFKMQSEKHNLAREKRENCGKWNAWREGAPKEETYRKYGGASRKIEIGDIENMGRS